MTDSELAAHEGIHHRLFCPTIHETGRNLEKARELIETQESFGSGYPRNTVRLILAEVQREHGQEAVNLLIRECPLELAFGLKPGNRFDRVVR